MHWQHRSDSISRHNLATLFLTLINLIWDKITFNLYSIKGVAMMINPIHQIVSDELYATLVELNLLNKKVLRDFQIKRRYLELRHDGFRSADSIERILDEYPYLQFDTVRKIIYSVKLPEELEAIYCA